MPLHVLSTVVLIIRRSKLYYTASGIITPVCGRPMHLMIDYIYIYIYSTNNTCPCTLKKETHYSKYITAS